MSIYWGGRIDGSFYQSCYGSPNNADVPFSGSEVANAALAKFRAHAGKNPTLTQWGGNLSSWPPVTFDATAAGIADAAGMFSQYDWGAPTAGLNDILANNATAHTNIGTLASQILAFARPVLFRPLWEMNGNWFAWGTSGFSDADYITIWRNLWQIFADIMGGHAAGSGLGTDTGNASFFWCPNIWSGGGMPDPTPRWPGAAFVDWMGFDGYIGNRFGTTYETPGALYNTTYATVAALDASLPMAIGEWGVGHNLSAPGKAGFFTAMLDPTTGWLAAHPRVKSFSYFNDNSFESAPDQSLCFEQNTLGCPSGVNAPATAFSSAIAGSYYDANIVDGTTFPSNAKVPIPGGGGVGVGVFSYNGSGTVTCTLSDAVNGNQYRLDCDDPSGAFDVQTASGTTLVLTATGITGLAAGDTFFATLCRGTAAGVLISNATTDYTDCCVFSYGSTTGYTHPSAVFAYDGTIGLSVTFTVEDAAATYGLGASAAANYNGTFGNVFGGPYALGSSQTISLTLAGTPAYAGFFVYFHDDRGSIGYRDRAVRAFAPSVAGSGTSGTPGAAVVLAAVVSDGRVLIAFNDTPLEPNPVWARIDDTNNLVSGYDIQTGKQTELDRTDTGTATIYINDTTGLFDPLNTGSPYFGKLVGKQILLQLWNPVTSEWVQEWRGKIRDYGYAIFPVLGGDGKPILANIQVDCVDIFDYLGGYGLQPGLDGTTPPAGSEGIVFYKDTLEADLLDSLGATVNRRIIEGLTDAGIDSTRWIVFSGNVAVQDAKYDPGDALLNVLRDAADAEFPGLANIYVDRFGRFVFHGRRARFDPEGVIAGGPLSTDTWDFHRWKVGDGTAITGDSGYAQIRVLAYTNGESDIVNSAVAWPANIKDTLMPGQVYEDATSITNYGKHSLPPMSDLIIREGLTTGNSANVECQKFAEFFVHYLKNPQTRITSLMVKAIGPTDTRAASTWDVICKADISDIMRTTVGYPGGVGIDSDNYIEGYVKRVRPLNPTHDYVEVEFNLTPTSWSMDPDAILARVAVSAGKATAHAAGSGARA